MTAFKFELWSLGMTKLAEFTPTQAEWSMNVKDGSGSFTFTIPRALVPAELDTGVVDVVIAQDGAYVWRGQVLGEQFTATGARYDRTWTAVGLFELLADRFLPSATSYTGPTTTIVDSIVTAIQAQANGAIVIGQTVFVDWSQDPAFGYVDPTVTKTYDQPTSAKDAIEELALIYPFDFTLHPIPSGRYGLVGGAPYGTALPMFVCLPSGYYFDSVVVPLTHGSNVEEITGAMNLAPGGPFCNYVEAYGAGNTAPITASDTALMTQYRRRDKVTFSTDSNDFADTLLGRATTVLFDGKPRRIPTVTLRTGENLLELGQSVHLRSDIVASANGKWRVIGRQVRWPLNQSDAFKQVLQLEPWQARDFDPFA